VVLAPVPVGEMAHFQLGLLHHLRARHAEGQPPHGADAATVAL
jgi:hypothetical protein